MESNEFSVSIMTMSMNFDKVDLKMRKLDIISYYYFIYNESVNLRYNHIVGAPLIGVCIQSVKFKFQLQIA